MNAKIRHTHHEDASALSDLCFRSKAHWGYSLEFMENCREELTVSREFLQLNPAFILMNDQKIVGFYALEEIDKETVELSYLFVEPAHIGKGYGRKLLLHAKIKAKSLSYKLMVIQGDPNAEAFYRAIGAVTVGEKESISIPGRMLPLLNLELDW